VPEPATVPADIEAAPGGGGESPKEEIMGQSGQPKAKETQPSPIATAAGKIKINLDKILGGDFLESITGKIKPIKDIRDLLAQGVEPNEIAPLMREVAEILIIWADTLDQFIVPKPVN